jgi:hypothetical protein
LSQDRELGGAMRFPTMGDAVIHPRYGRVPVTHWREIKGRREYFSGAIRLGFLEEVLPMVVDLIIRPSLIKTTTRLTIDLPSKLSDAASAAALRVDMTKAQYVRTAVELLNLLTDHPEDRLLLRRNDKTTRIVIPGINK